jgi:hypothetical protein
MATFFNIILWILKWICFLVAFLWLWLVAVAIYVSINSPPYQGGQPDAAAYGMAAVLFGVVGLPAVIASIIILIVGWVSRKSD